MAIRVDQRTVHFERDTEALAAVADRRADWLEEALSFARLLCGIDRTAAFLSAGCASIQELASRRGYDPHHARELCHLGYAIEALPELEKLLRANQIGFAAASALGRVHKEPALLQPDDEWVQWARFERLSALKRRIRIRVESHRQGRPANVPWNAHVTARTAEYLGLCRRVASQKAGVMLTNGQLLEVIATAYLLEHDQLEGTVQRDGADRAPADDQTGTAGDGGAPAGAARHGPGSGKRRLPPTADRPQDRTIPAEVARALEERSGGLCEFGACDRPAMESCHLEPHRQGSGREINDLVRGCRLHHKAFDAGLITFRGWTTSTDPLGTDLPVFQAAETHEILKPKPHPQAGCAAGGEAERAPAWVLRALGRRLRGRYEARCRTRTGTAAPAPARADARAPPQEGEP